MKKVNKSFIINIYLELCCAMCHFKNLHPGHKIIEINDEEALKRENINFDALSKKFNENNQKIINLKDKIEKEIVNINKSYDIVEKQVNNKFQEEHEKLILEENTLKEKLQNEVTKAKEHLEKCLSEANQLIISYERINKGIKALAKEEKNMIKILTYITNMNKSNEQMNNFDNEFIKKLEFTFDEKQKNIIYKEYLINGLPVPKEIVFNDISWKGFKIEWKIDESKISQLDKNKITYKVLLRKSINENKNQDNNFEQVYSDVNTNCTINYLNANTKYEIKITCVYNDLQGEYSEIKNIKTDYCDLIRPNPFLSYLEPKD